jgi:hypothetical protein
VAHLVVAQEGQQLQAAGLGADALRGLCLNL